MLLREVNRSAAVAWSPLASRPSLFAAATLAGTMTVDFDPSGKLEIFDISERASRGLQDPLDMACVGLTSTSERVHRLAWRNPLPASFENGLIVGGLGSGVINIWNPTSLIERTQGDPLVASLASHSGAINALDFNPLQPTLLASGGPNGELYIFNLADPRKPTVHQPGTNNQSPNMGAITSVAFHPRHRHILASSSQNGTTVIWDLREKRPAYSFSDPNRSFHCKSIAWHPEQPMLIAAASDDDEAPLINMWDLHMTIAPNSILKGHQRGIMSIAWCTADKSLLTSAGKDNRTLVWDVSTATLVSEIGSSSNWNLDVQWSPKLPTLMSTCSLDGKVRIFSVSDLENLATPRSTEVANHQLHASSKTSAGISEDDLFNSKGPNSHHSTVSSANLVRAARLLSNGAKVPPRPPTWLKRPAGATFAFGGLLVSFNAQSKAITKQHIASHDSLSTRASALQTALETNQFAAFCQDKLQSLSPEQTTELETWHFLKSLLQSHSRQDLLAQLDMDPEMLSETINRYLRTLPTPAGMLNETEQASAPPASDAPATSNGSSHPDDGLFGDADEASFGSFVIPAQPKAESTPKINLPTPRDMSPIHFNYADQTEKVLTNALMIGDYEAAVECCVRIGKMADALVIAACGGDALWKRTQAIFFRQNKEKSYLQIVAAIANKDWSHFIQRIDLAHWKEALAILCTHPSEDSFKSLCSELGKRLEEAQLSTPATLCYLCASAVDQVTAAWMKSLTGASAESSDAGQRHMLMHELMEKVLVFAAAAKVSPSQLPDIVLHQYARYAELLANQGLFEISLKYLKLLDLKSNATSVAAQSSLHLLDRVYRALPANVAQSIYGGPLTSLYQGKTTNQTGRTVGSTAKATGGPLAHQHPISSTSMGVKTPMGAKQAGNQATTPMNNANLGNTFRPSAAAAHPSGPVTMFTPVAPTLTLNHPVAAMSEAPPPMGGQPRPGPRTTASFVPISPVAPGVVSTPVSTFVPGPVGVSNGGGAVPPPTSSAKKARPAGPATFTPSVPKPAAEAFVHGESQVAAQDPPGKKKKKVKKTSSLGPAMPASAVPAPTFVGSNAPTILPGPPAAIGGHFAGAQGLGASAVSSVAIPPPKARTSRVVPPNMNRSAPGPAGPVGAGPPPGASSGPYPGPPPPSRPPTHADPSTWDPQAPLPAHLLAAAGPGPAKGFAPPASGYTPPGFAPPPAGSFMPSGAMNGGFAEQGGFQTFQPGRGSNMTSAPPAAATPPPPKPGRAKKAIGAPVVAPTPAYITGPEAEAMAAPKNHEPSQAEIDLLSTLVAVLDKIATTGDTNHADLVARFEDFNSKMMGGHIPAAVVPLLSELAQAMISSRIADAQEKHGEITNSPYYHAIGSKAMLGMKRMIILIQRYNL